MFLEALCVGSVAIMEALCTTRTITQLRVEDVPLLHVPGNVHGDCCVSGAIFMQLGGEAMHVPG